ncbi:glycosyltransferase [Seonamhaeicola sp. MEBiC1930]|uniref:glycosyltransferase n=1 Tax=Seonamhaeicola sp. MEBiC01930 TaxID=2976768 RepID=UPI00324BB97C
MMKKIKVLETIRQGKIGGGETHVLDLVANIDTSNFEPIVLSFTDGPMVERVKELGVDVHVIYTEKPYDIRVWGKVKQFMVDHEIDIVHAHGTRANSNVFWAAKKLGLPIVYTVHGWSFHQGQRPLIKMLRIKNESFLTKKADVTIAVSHSNQKDGIDLFGMSNSKVVTNGINTEKYGPSNKLRDLREELGLPKNKTIVGYLVRMTEQKDPLTLIRAIRKVKDQTSDIAFLLMGNGDLVDDAKALCKELDIEDMVVWSGFRQDIPDVLNTIDIYTLPSLWEGLPIGLLEAMSMAKPIVATGVDGTKEVISDGENGILIECGDYENLAKAFIELHEDKVKMAEYGKKSREIVCKRYAVNRMCREIEEIYFQQIQNYDYAIQPLN